MLRQNKTVLRILQFSSLMLIVFLSGCAIQPGGYGYTNSYYHNYPIQQETTPIWTNPVPYYGGGYPENRDWNNNDYSRGDNYGDRWDNREDH